MSNLPRLIVVWLFACNSMHAASANDIVDPMRPPTATRAVGVKPAAQKPAGPRLSAVLFSGERRVAVIDGRAVQEGDRVRDAVVVEIFVDGVRLARAGQAAQTLRLIKSVTP
ncbi:MAG: hypothetical protein H7Y02_00595, partial [Candidatus Obscuribacterales bacterium]|nr:hypothetical protein [Steroidobacteraceae bacterium]